jgi:hypothetical protein
LYKGISSHGFGEKQLFNCGLQIVDCGFWNEEKIVAKKRNAPLPVNIDILEMISMRFGVRMSNKIFYFNIDLSTKIRYIIYSIPAGPLLKGMLTSAGFSFYEGGRT